MTWTAPRIDRVDPPLIADERSMLEGWLDYHRATLQVKCAGLTGAQLAEAAVPPSTLTLLGLVRHLAEVERSWLRGGWDPTVTSPLFDSTHDPDADFNDLDPDRAAADLASYRAEVEAARAESARHDLTETITAPWRSEPRSLRWIYLHLIEEYARHNGHADLLRERIDQVTGE